MGGPLTRGPASWPDVLPPLEDRAVHLWRVDLGGEPFPGIDAILDPHERSRVARFAFDRDRNRYAHAHHALRVLLGAYLHERPERIAIASNRHGKPLLSGHSLGFNISHSADRGLIAISRLAEIGADVEMRVPAEARGIAESVFSPAELDALAGRSGDAFATAFRTCWARKEAVLKALGVGFALIPSTVSVGVDGGRARVTVAGGETNAFVEVASLAGRSDCAEAVAAVGGFSDVVVLEYGRR